MKNLIIIFTCFIMLILCTFNNASAKYSKISYTIKTYKTAPVVIQDKNNYYVSFSLGQYNSVKNISFQNHSNIKKNISLGAGTNITENTSVGISVLGSKNKNYNYAMMFAEVKYSHIFDNHIALFSATGLGGYNINENKHDKGIDIFLGSGISYIVNKSNAIDLGIRYISTIKDYNTANAQITFIQTYLGYKYNFH